MKLKGNYNKIVMAREVIKSLSDMVPSLEYLSIEWRDIPGQINLEFPKLKKLKMINCWSQSHRPNFAVVCPELEHLDVSGNQ